MKITKAIIPAAGLGTRMLPATKAVPKEMLPVNGKPVIQYVVEEAINSGITDILIVLSKGKEVIQKHFSKDEILENELKRKGKLRELALVRRISEMANIQYIEQVKLNGLGDAISYGREFAGDDHFTVLLGDNIIQTKTDTPVLKQLMDVHAIHQTSVVGVQKVAGEHVSRYGILDGQLLKAPHTYKVNGWVEKPKVEEAPSNIAIAGLYIFTPKIFEILAQTLPGKNNEIQITDAMHALLRHESMHAYQYQGIRYDIGNQKGFIEANQMFSVE